MNKNVHHAPGGKVAMFKLRPRMGFIWLAVALGVLGGMYVVQLQADAYYDPSLENRANLVITITALLVWFCLIMATARMWFAHLWHRRK
jgi:hypothetical protein